VVSSDSSVDGELKRRVAEVAAALVPDGIVVGLGSGSTAHLFVEALAARVRAGLRMIGVPTSEATAELARSGGITLATLEEQPQLDMVIDGADEVDPELNLIKGLGGALLREKIVASSTKNLVIIVDDRKLVRQLGERVPIPVEIVPFGWRRTEKELGNLGARPVQRMTGTEPYLTDGGHFILDCWFDPTHDLKMLAPAIKALTGVVEHGLFLHMASRVLVGYPDRVETISRARQ